MPVTPPYTVEVCAPTLNRPEKLARMLASVHAAAVGPDGDAVLCRLRIGREVEPRPLHACVNDLFRASAEDIVVMGADDLEFLPGSLYAVARAFAEHFPDLDGYVGLNLTNQPPIPNCTEFAFFAVGRRFLDRFPDRELFCPEYWHFSSDTELGLFAKAIGKFHWAEDARVVHHHPNFSRDPADETHRISRSRKEQDARIRVLRRERGLLWGVSWERVNAEGLV